MKIWGKIFARRKKNLWGKACPIEFFFFINLILFFYKAI